MPAAIAAAEGELVQLREDNGRAWMHEAQSEFTRARAAYEQALEEADRARERLEQEAALCAFVAGAAAPQLASSLIVRTPGVEGSAQSLPAAGVLEALRDALTDLDWDVLRTRA